MIKKYRLYIHSEKHKDIYDFLEGIRKPLRGEFIRTAIRFFLYNAGNKLSGMQVETTNKTNKFSNVSEGDTFTDVFG